MYLQVHLQNASLAGGVAVGTIAPMIIQPWGAVLIGFVSGALSTSSFKYTQVLRRQFYYLVFDMWSVSKYISLQMNSFLLLLHLDTGQIYTFASIFLHFVFQPWLIRRLKVHDTCGVNSLHGLPGILGAVAGTISSSIAGYKQYKTR